MENCGMETKKGAQAAATSGHDPRDQKIADLEAKVKTLTELGGRAQADLQNAKVRLGKQAAELGDVTLAEFLRTILPTLDHFQRAFQHLPPDLNDHEWVQGVTAIEQGLMKQVEALGLRRMASMGQSLDPHRHEVLLTIPGDPGKVLEVIEEGYEFRGRVLRPAKVKVGSSPPTDQVAPPAPEPTSGGAAGVPGSGSASPPA